MQEDHIDKFLKRLAVLPPDSGIDLEVEGVVDRINSIGRRIKKCERLPVADHGAVEPTQTLTGLG